LINFFLIANYLIYFLIGADMTGFTILINAEYGLPLLIIQLTVFFFFFIGGVLFSSLEEKINEFSRYIIRKRKTVEEKYKTVKKHIFKAMGAAAAATLILGIPLVIFMADITSLFGVSLTISIIELSLLLVAFTLFSVFYIQFKIFEIINIKNCLIILATAIGIAIIIPILLFTMNLTSVFLGITIGILISQVYAVIISAVYIDKKLKLI
ncbi:MAG: hypothetical protein ACTSQY_08540, partial [Candidatus Odinarchaeia archaeon]